MIACFCLGVGEGLFGLGVLLMALLRWVLRKPQHQHEGGCCDDR